MMLKNIMKYVFNSCKYLPRVATGQRAFPGCDVLQTRMVAGFLDVRKWLNHAVCWHPTCKCSTDAALRAGLNLRIQAGLRKASIHAGFKGACKRSIGAGYSASPDPMRLLKRSAHAGLRTADKPSKNAGFREKNFFKKKC